MYIEFFPPICSSMIVSSNYVTTFDPSLKTNLDPTNLISLHQESLYIYQLRQV